MHSKPLSMIFLVLAVGNLCSCTQQNKNKGRLTNEELSELLHKCGRRSYRTPKFKVYHVNGSKPAAPGQFPWMVLLIKLKHYWPQDIKLTVQKMVTRKLCGGALISQRHVLTAAHCIIKDCQPVVREFFGPERFLVFAGGTDLEDRSHGTTYMVRKVSVFPKFANRKCTDYGDIALLELEDNVPYDVTFSMPICLAGTLDEQRHYTQVAGWGKNPQVIGGVFRVTKLLHTEVLKMQQEKCARRYKMSIGKLSADKICTHEEDSDPCQGDSGGPLMQSDMASNRWRAIGVVSFGGNCTTIHLTREKGNIPRVRGSVYTDVRHHVPWICQKTGVCPFNFK